MSANQTQLNTKLFQTAHHGSASKIEVLLAQEQNERMNKDVAGHGSAGLQSVTQNLGHKTSCPRKNISTIGSLQTHCCYNGLTPQDFIMTTNSAATDVFNIFKRMTPFIQHACEGNVEEVRALLAQGEAFDPAAVMGAAMSGQHECLELFLPLDEKYWTLALMNSTMEGHEKCVRLLLDAQPNQWSEGVVRALTDSVLFKHPHCTQVFIAHIQQMTKQQPNTVIAVDWNNLAFQALEHCNSPSFCAVFPYCDPTHPKMLDCLETAAVKGLSECVQLLAPLSTQWSEKSLHDILMKTIWKGHSNVVRILVPLVNVAFDNSFALQVALGLGDEEIAEFLYPHSDLEVVLEQLKPQDLPPDHLHRLRELIETRRQHSALTTVTNCALSRETTLRHKKI